MGDLITAVAKPLEAVLAAMTHLIGNYGLSIVLFTLLVRLIISPLNLAQLRSARAMSALSPRIKELQKFYAQDRERLTKETMALYKQYNVNPAAGCLPLLIQLPVLWGLFNALLTFAHSKPGESIYNPAYHGSFLWLSNLGASDPTHILAILAGVFQWVQTRMMMQKTTDAQQQQMNQIMQFMPLMIILFAWNYPAGLAVYWVTSTTFSIMLQYLITGWGQLPYLSANGPYGTPGAGILGGRITPPAALVADAPAAPSRIAAARVMRVAPPAALPPRQPRAPRAVKPAEQTWVDPTPSGDTDPLLDGSPVAKPSLTARSRRSLNRTSRLHNSTKGAKRSNG